MIYYVFTIGVEKHSAINIKHPVVEKKNVTINSYRRLLVCYDFSRKFSSKPIWQLSGIWPHACDVAYAQRYLIWW